MLIGIAIGLVAGLIIGVIFGKQLKNVAQHPVTAAAEATLPAAKAAEAAAAK